MNHLNLSPFQVEKLTFLFEAFFKDPVMMDEKLKTFCGWSENEPRYKRHKEVLNAFNESWLEAALTIRRSSEDSTTNPVSLDDWLKVWSRLCVNANTIRDFPFWARQLPRLFFSFINTNGNGILSHSEYLRFFIDIIGLQPKEKAHTMTTEAFEAMTASGKYELDLETFSFCFVNFILGKTVYGPGKFIFGVFGGAQPYTIDFSSEAKH